MRRLTALLALVLIGAAPLSDGRRAFDFEIGRWTMAPSGYGHEVQRLWDGGTIGRLEIPAPKPHVAGSMLKVYSAATRRWSLYWADATDGTVSPPLVGTFAGGRGTFTGRDTVRGRPLLVRLVYFDIDHASFKTQQSVSRDAGKTWKPGPVQTYTRTST
ncbi:MAG TPA: hypothetical protein VGN14_10050 [Candidatus Elarobacter sp.]|jgi:hypothetical protein